MVMADTAIHTVKALSATISSCSTTTYNAHLISMYIYTIEGLKC